MAGFRYGLAALFLVVTTAAVVAKSGDRGLDVEARTKLNRKVADAGIAATVGIYCSRGKHEKYYGTGVLISADGYLLTSTTVVPDGSEDIEVYLTERVMRLAKIVEVNEALEATLLKIEMDKKIPFLPLAKALPEVGETAYSFGNANHMIRLGEGASFSVGVVSGVYDVKSADSQSTYQGLAIETDAAINPGQDGGPLLNAYGQLTGVISLSYADNRWQGMAVPVARLLEELKALKGKQVKFSTEALIKPPKQDLAAGNPLAETAAKVSSYLAAIEIKRQYPAEELPHLYLPTYLKTIKNFDDLTPPQQQQLMNEFGNAERTLEANRQLRRPDTPVTGVVISADGLILTSLFNVLEDNVLLHKKDGLRKVEYKGRLQDLVVINPKDFRQETNKIQSIQVKLADGQALPAKIVSRHHVLGMALLKVEAKDLPFLDLDKVAGPPVLGEAIAVVGVAAAKTPYTLNTGAVSAEDRQRGYQFQFDAMINYGNSGGPVVTENGTVCGFAAHPMVPSPFMGRVLSPQDLQSWLIALNGGVSFGARTDMILAELPTMKEGKEITQIHGAFLGVAPNQANVLSDKVLIGQVVPNSPAAKAGLRVNDQILSLDGEAMTSWKQLIETVSGRKEGDTIKLQVSRSEKEEYLEIEGEKVATQDDLKKVFKKLKHGQEVKAKFSSVGAREFEVEVKLEERK